MLRNETISRIIRKLVKKRNISIYLTLIRDKTKVIKPINSKKIKIRSKSKTIIK